MNAQGLAVGLCQASVRGKGRRGLQGACGDCRAGCRGSGEGPSIRNVNAQRVFEVPKDWVLQLESFVV